MKKYFKNIGIGFLTLFILIFIYSFAGSKLLSKTTISKTNFYSDTSGITFQEVIDSTYDIIFDFNELQYIEQKLTDSIDYFNDKKAKNGIEMDSSSSLLVSKIVENGLNKKDISLKQLNDFVKRRTGLDEELYILGKKVEISSDSLKKIKDIISAKKKKYENTLKEIAGRSDSLIGKKEFKFKNNKCLLFIVNKGIHDVQIQIGNKSPFSFNNFNKYLLNNKFGDPLMITNGGMFKPDYTAQGFLVINNKQINNIDTTIKKFGNFYLLPNGIFFVDSVGNFNVQKTSSYKTEYYDKKEIPKLATQSGPMLVVDGKINSKLTVRSENLNIRSGVGLMNNNKIVFIISSEGINFYDFALIFKDYFHCSNALYLDGAISKMYFKGSGSMPEGDFGPIIGITEKK